MIAIKDRWINKYHRVLLSLYGPIAIKLPSYVLSPFITIWSH